MKKTKEYYIYSIIIGLFSVLFFSCQSDIGNTMATITGAVDNDILNAQAWYNSTRQDTILSFGFAKVKSTKKNMTAKPDWKHGYTIREKDYSAVHVQLYMKGTFNFITPENKQAYNATGDERYIKTFTRMVVLTSKKDSTVGFLMTLIPDKAYIESTHFDALRSNYKQWQKGYSGYVFYHTLDGKFNNGWRFANGKVIKEVTQAAGTDLNLKMGVKKKVTAESQCTDYAYEVYSQDCKDWTSNGEYVGTTCSGNWYFDGYKYAYTECTYEVVDTGGGGSGTVVPDPNGGYTGGGGNNNSSGAITGNNYNHGLSKPIPFNTNSQDTKVYAVSNTLTIYGSSVPATQIANLVNYLRTKVVEAYEWAMVLQKSDNDVWAIKQDNGDMVWTNNDPVRVSIATNDYTYLIVHTHVGNDLTTPSPLDVINLCQNYNDKSKSIFGNLILAKDGSESVIYVDDPVKFQQFCASIANDTLFNTDSKGYFNSQSSYAAKYNAAYNKILAEYSSQSVSSSYAISYVLDYFNTGLKIAYRANSSAVFKTQQTLYSSDTDKYYPSICQ